MWWTCEDKSATISQMPQIRQERHGRMGEDAGQYMTMSTIWAEASIPWEEMTQMHPVLSVTLRKHTPNDAIGLTEKASMHSRSSTNSSSHDRPTKKSHWD
jgi:hypothetical protein